MRNEVELVKSMFSQIPPDYGNIKELLRRAAFSSEELAAIAYCVAEDCFCEYRDALNDTGESETLDALHSNYLLQSLRLLLDAGLDPNVCSGYDNVLWHVQWVDTPGVAASAMRLLPENGGDPNHKCTDEQPPQEPGKHGCCIMHIYDIASGEEVARCE